MIRIVTDSTCEGPDELFAHPAVHVVPLYAIFGQESLRDRVDISTDQFWERLPKSKTLPTTSQATPGDFLDPFKRYTDAGDEVIAVVLAAKLSGTCESAMLAQEALPGRPISVLDSTTISVGLGLMVQKACAMIDAGANRPQIVAQLMKMRSGIRIMFALETLEYLQKGGRVGRAQAFVGSLLQFKPLLSLKEGEVFPVTRVRSKRKALDTMMELLGCEITERGPRVKIGVLHACTLEEAQSTAQQIGDMFQTPHVFIGQLGPVIGVHVGPGTVGAAVYVDDADRRSSVDAVGSAHAVSSADADF